jgi:transposase
MMGFQPDAQPKLFYHSFNLDDRIPAASVLRKIRKHIDFEFIYQEVKDCYGGKGNVPVPPPVILKMMLLLILYNVRSEREMMNTLPMRLDWLWFLDYDLDSEIPNHSVLSKARNRWVVAAFQGFFERIVWQCVEAGLVDGSKLFMYSSLVRADASNNSVVKINKETLKIRSFARATRYGCKRARWRRLWRVHIQEYLTSAIQNIMTLLSYGKERGMAKGFALSFAKKLSSGVDLLFSNIHGATYRFGNEFFFTMYVCLRPMSERL